MTVEKEESPNTLILLLPASPYACIGYHQDLEKEIDLQYLKKKQIPVIRRSQGGGATYLDSNQIFYQIISKKSQVIPKKINELFEKMLKVTVETYRALGVPAEFKPLNDVIVNGKKISGNGASSHSSTTILVGNIIIDLNYEQMARVLKVSDEKFRDKIAKSMVEWVTSLKRELDVIPSVEIIKEKYKEMFQKQLGLKLIKASPTNEEWKIFNEQILPQNLSYEWLYMEPPISLKSRSIKIAHEVKIVEVEYKVAKLIRIRAEIFGEYITNIQIRGDFFVVPKESIKILEEKLVGCKIDDMNIKKVIEDFYKHNNVDTPGITSRDFIQAILKINK
ncbi:hypothetical protein JW865_08665 [Candidatus Bathyarchaeota archaeon]|nr:hypothetical protein [Candidatus Bathyarchaeota archaeon]